MQTNRSAFSRYRAMVMLSIAMALRCLGAAAPTPANAAEKAVMFDIPAGAAADALRTLSRQSARQLIYVGTAVAGQTTRAVHGRMTIHEALAQMLAGTSLDYVYDAKGDAFAIRRSAPRKPVPEVTEERVILSPFSVSAQADIGFVAATSLAGGRMATALKDTPAAYSVITREFVEAFNLGDVVEAAQWSPNVNQNEGDNGGRMYGNSPVTMLRIRGVKMGLPTRNFFTVSRTGDSYNLDRVDLARGPNSVLFGAGGIAGTLNAITKQAETTRDFAALQVRLGSFSRYRTTLDLNRAVTDQLGLRANLLYDDGGTWRDNEFNRKQGASLALKWEASSRLSVRAELEYFKQLDGTVNASIRDRISAWDGLTTIGRLSTPLDATTMATAGFAVAPQRFVENPNWGRTFINFQNEPETRGAQYGPTLATTNRINGVPIRTVGFTLNDQAIVDAEDGVPRDRWVRALAGSPFFQRPRRTDTTIWTNRSLPLATQQSVDGSLFLNYSPRENLFFEVAGSASTSRQLGENTQRRGLINLMLDVHRYLPSGDPNPGFLKDYVDVFNYRTSRNYTIGQVRAQGVYVRNTSLGRLQASVVAGSHEQRVDAIGTSMLLPLTSLAGDARAWTDASTLSEFGAYTRWYVNDGSPRIWHDNSNQFMTAYNPLNGITEQVRPRFMYDTRREENNYIGFQTFRFLQAAGNFDLFHNRLVVIGAFRRDFTSIYTRRAIYPGDNPAGWDGLSRLWRPDAPADYYQLTYQLKDPSGQIIDPQPLAATNRPRGRTLSGANLPFPQYAADRFQDDYNAPIYRANVNTYTYGAVFNVTRALGVYANASTTFDLSLPAQRVDGSLVPPTASQGEDFGIRYTLPGNRLSVSLGRYTSYQDGATVRATSNLNVYSTIAAAPVVGDLSATGRNIRGFHQLPQDIYSTITNATRGYEFEVTANLVPGWRLVMNAGYVDAVEKNQQPDVLRWIPQQDQVIRQILADAGAVIDASNMASIPTALNDPTRINVPKVQAAVEAWNQLQSSIIPNLKAQQPRPIGGMTKWTANLASDYRFQHGFFRGLRIGAGLNFRSGQIIGFRGSDTIRDPNNPDVAIDDPAVDANTVIVAPSYTKAVASLAYTWRLPESRRSFSIKTIDFDLNIDNLFNHTDVVYSNINDIVQTSVTNFRPRVGEDITSPARRTVPGNFGYLTPRNATISVRFNF